MGNRFDGRVAVVTGAGAGIGRAVAQQLAAEGAKVAALDRDLAAAAGTVASIQQNNDDDGNDNGAASTGTHDASDGNADAKGNTDANGNGRALAIAADVTSPTDVKTAIGTAIEEFGGIDVLINNAGVVRYGAVTEFSVEDWDLVIDTNLKGSFLTAKYAIPSMRERGGGAIVNTASAQAFASQPTVAAYSASKGAIVAMTRTLALDHAADGIRVNCICPGSVETPMLRYGAEYFFDDRDPAATMREWGGQHPIGRLIQPADVARVITFLASDDASVITGAPYLVDGGLLAKLGV